MNTYQYINLSLQLCFPSPADSICKLLYCNEVSVFQVMWPAFNLWHLLAAIFYYQWNQSLIDKLQTTRELKVCCCFLDRNRATRSGLDLDFFY
jgi:hypothetical protein